MSVVTHPGSVDSHTHAEHALRLASAMTAVFLAFTLPATFVSLGRSAGIIALIVHVVGLWLACWAALAEYHEPNILRDWAPLLIGPYLYIELRWVIDVVGRPHFDELVQRWESGVFPTDPSRTLASDMQSVVVSELLHLAYLSYYALVYVPPAILYWRHRRDEFANTMLALIVVYALCFSAFLFFPVDGPRFLQGPSDAPRGPFRSIVLAVLESGSSRGTAFPSSHVAVSVVASLCALRFQRRVGWFVAILTALMALGAVYGGFHYAIDVVAGVAVGVLAFVLAMVQVPRIAASQRLPYLLI